MGEHLVDPADEGRHVADLAALWQESVYLDFVDDEHSIGGYVRLGVYPNLGVTWWAAAVVRHGQPLALSASFDLSPLKGEFAVDERGVAVSVGVEQPLVRCRVLATAGARGYAEPADVYAGRAGAETSLGVDLTWHTDGTPYHYDLTSRYEVPCVVDGTVLVDGEPHAVRGHGQRDHSWGTRDWWTFGWCWAALRMDDGTRLHGADVRVPGIPPLGYEQRGAVVTQLHSFASSERTDEEGLATSAHLAFRPGGDVAIEPVSFAPLLLKAPDGRVSRFPRAMARARRDDGVVGSGWIEWNQPII